MEVNRRVNPLSEIYKTRDKKERTNDKQKKQDKPNTFKDTLEKTKKANEEKER